MSVSIIRETSYIPPHPRERYHVELQDKAGVWQPAGNYKVKSAAVANAEFLEKSARRPVRIRDVKPPQAPRRNPLKKVSAREVNEAGAHVSHLIGLYGAHDQGALNAAVRYQTLIEAWEKQTGRKWGAMKAKKRNPAVKRKAARSPAQRAATRKLLAWNKAHRRPKRAAAPKRKRARRSQRVRLQVRGKSGAWHTVVTRPLNGARLAAQRLAQLGCSVRAVRA